MTNEFICRFAIDSAIIPICTQEMKKDVIANWEMGLKTSITWKWQDGGVGGISKNVIRGNLFSSPLLPANRAQDFTHLGRKPLQISHTIGPSRETSEARRSMYVRLLRGAGQLVELGFCCDADRQSRPPVLLDPAADHNGDMRSR